MPISRNGNLYYTPAQFERAREISALDYARQQGYELKQSGNSFIMKEHDSMVFRTDGSWFWNSQNQSGRAVDFMVHYENRALVEAVLILNGEPIHGQAPHPIPPKTQQVNTPIEKKPFELPPRAGNFKRLFGYLCGTRKLDRDIVQELVNDKRLYLSEQHFDYGAGTRTSYNATFVSYDYEGKAVGAFNRGTMSEVKYARDVIGSDKTYGWLMRGMEGTSTVYVFEAAIDAASHATIYKQHLGGYKDAHRLSLGGCANHQPVYKFLQQHPEVKTIILAFDADEAGQKAVQELGKNLRSRGFTKEQGYVIQKQKPSLGKDFNEHLITYKAQQELTEEMQYQARDDPTHEADMEMGA